LKLVDFGLSCVSSPGQRLQTFSGTEAYCAAEILAGRPYDGRLIDSYSAGVFLYICLTGSYPFSQDLEVQHQEQTDSLYLGAMPFPEGVSKEGKDLVLRLLEPSPLKRASIQDALNHPYLANVQRTPMQQQEANVESREVSGLQSEPSTSPSASKMDYCEADDDDGADDDEFAFEAIPESGFDAEMAVDHANWEEGEWEALSEEFNEGSIWEDNLTPESYCKQSL